MGNHWRDSDSLVIEEKTLLGAYGYVAYPSGAMLSNIPTKEQAPGGYARLFRILSTHDGEGWRD